VDFLGKLVIGGILDSKCYPINGGVSMEVLMFLTGTAVGMATMNLIWLWEYKNGN
jgi:hypothetical protein